MTLNDKISVLRDKLNNSIINSNDKDKIYALSVLLDQLIVCYYNKDKNKKINIC